LDENGSFFHILLDETMKTNTKFWTSPFAIGAFILSVLTGLLLFFNAVIGISQSAHVLLSSMFVIAVVFHTVINWNQFN
jgi:hypothetical protein